MSTKLAAYLPQDRVDALANGVPLPDRTDGSVLFADISGFTPLTEALTNAYGPRRGIEEVSRQINAVYDALIVAVDRFGGSVIGFAGDAITCWFGGQEAAPRAVACGFAQQIAMQTFRALPLPKGATATLAIKVAVATGPVRRFVVGDPTIQRLDTLAGATVARIGEGEHLCQRGEVLVDEATAHLLGQAAQVMEWRTNKDTGTRFAVIREAARLPEEVNTPPANIPLDQLNEWVLPAIAARELAGQGEFVTEFRPALSLFARFSGIDYEQDDAEDRLNAFIVHAQRIVNEYGGTLLQLTIADKGSYIHIVFGAPVAHEDDPRRAVKAALDLQELPRALPGLNPLQIGVTRGVLSAGVLGGSTRRTYNTWGDEVNLAARVMGVAAPGETLLSGRAQQAVAAAYVFEPRPPLPLKGKSEPLPVFAVTGVRQQRGIRLQEPAYALPMVGRQAELQTVRTRLELAAQGQGQVVGIAAEAGMGKSRLVAEVIRIARRLGFSGYGGACQPDTASTPYFAWKAVWGAFFGVDPELPLRKQVRLLEGELEDRAPRRVDALPLLGAVLNLPLADNEFTSTLEPEYRKSALHALLTECLKSTARDEPILLVIEDVQWIDPLSFDLLDEITRTTATFSVCIVLAYRPHELAQQVAAGLDGLPNITKVELTELTRSESEQAIRAKLAQLYPARRGGLTPALVDKLMARAQGNPFYLEELLNYLRDWGLDPFDEEDLAKIELPDSLHGLILSRIDQLSENEKLTLRVASVIGRAFRAAWLTGYFPDLGDHPRITAELDKLAGLDITPKDTDAPELSYLFKHIVTHEVTYESLPFVTRAHLHEQLATYLERLYADSLPLDLLAHHYGQTANLTKQREYLRRAGDSAATAYANESALGYYVRLLPLLTEPSEQADLLLRCGDILDLIGSVDDAEARVKTALLLSQGDAGRTAAAQYRLGSLSLTRSDYTSAAHWLGLARDGWSEIDNQVGLAAVMNQNSRLLYATGNHAAAREQAEEGLALAQVSGSRDSEIRLLNNLGVFAFNDSDYANAQVLFGNSLTLARNAGDRRMSARSLNNLGALAWRRNDTDAAGALYTESLSIAHEIGNREVLTAALDNLGTVAHMRGHYAVAQAKLTEALNLRREMGARTEIIESLCHLARLACHQGNYAEAQLMFEESLAIGREVDKKQYIAFSFMFLAYVSYLQQDQVQARTRYEESLILTLDTGDQVLMSMVQVGLGKLAHESGDYLMARELYGKSLAVASNELEFELEGEALQGLGLVTRQKRQYVEAAKLFQESLATAYKSDIKRNIVHGWIGLAAIVADLGGLIPAVNLAAAAEGLRTTIGLIPEPLFQRAYNETVAHVRTALGEADFMTAWAQGQNMTLEEAIELSLLDGWSAA